MPRLVPRRSTLVCLAVLVGLLLLSAFDPNGLAKARRQEQDAVRIERELSAMEEKVGALRREVKALRGDPVALERAARELGYVKPGEVVYKVNDGGAP